MTNAQSFFINHSILSRRCKCPIFDNETAKRCLKNLSLEFSFIIYCAQFYSIDYCVYKSSSLPGDICGGEEGRYGLCGEGLTCSNCNRCTGCSFNTFRYRSMPYKKDEYRREGKGRCCGTYLHESFSSKDDLKEKKFDENIHFDRVGGWFGAV